MISQIAKYTVEAELGRGGMGRVYRAFDPDVKRPVAIKVLTAESDPELLKRFRAEIDTTGNLQHKNIVTLYECGEESGVPYLVMELLLGQTVEALIKNKVPSSVLDKVRIMTQVAEGLSYAHSKGVIHRDVKPSNIMLLPDGSVKIMDFGIARVTSRSTVMTREGFIFGTIPYMSPEQFDSGGKADEQTDIFSYADVYYELLTGRQPFSVPDDMLATVRRVKTFEPEAVGQIVPGCPESLELLVHRAMAKDRDVRYQTFRELLLDSEAILVDLQRDRAVEILAEVGPLMESGNLEAAESKLLQVVELDPANREARQLRKTIKDKKHEQESAKRIATLFAESEAQIEQRQFAEAVHTLETAQRLNRNDPEVQQRLRDANSKLDAYLRASKLVAEARRDQQKGELEKALQRLHAALEFDAHHTDARMLALRVQTELDRRAREERVNRAIRTATEHRAQKKYDEAVAALQQLEGEDSDGRVAELRLAIQREKADSERRKRADRFNVGVSKLRQALQVHDLAGADQQLTFLSVNFGGEVGAAELLAQLRADLGAQLRADAISAFSKRARELMAQKNSREAREVVKEALDQFPDDTSLIRLRQETEVKYAAERRLEAATAILKDVNALRDRGHLEQALDIIALERQRTGEDPVLSDLSRQIEVELKEQQYASGLQQFVKDTRELIASQKYEEAIRALDQRTEYRNESEVKALLSDARTSAAMRDEACAVGASIEEAQRVERKESPELALQILERTLRTYPHNPDLAQAADNLRDHIAQDQLQNRIANHRARIERAIADGEWKKAEIAVSRAQRECPGLPLFDELSEEVKRALFDAGLIDLSAKVREKLAANHVTEAAEDLQLTRTLYSGDPRWQSLEREITTRLAYESALTEVAALRERGDVAEAEEQLANLVQKGSSSDDRAARMLQEVRDQRLADRMNEVVEAIERSDFDRGISLLQPLRSTAPQEWIAKIEAAYDEHVEREQQARERDISAIATHVREHLSQEEIVEAEAELARGSSKYPNESVWPSLEREINVLRALTDALLRADAERKQGNYDAADSILASFPDDQANPRLTALRAEIDADRESKQRADRAIEKAVQQTAQQSRELARNNQFSEALDLVNAGLQKYAGAPVLTQLKHELQIQWEANKRRAVVHQAAEQARQLTEQGRPEQALQLLQGIAGEAPEAELQKLLSQAQEEVWAKQQREVLEELVREAQERATRHDFDGALKILEQGIESWPREPKLTIALDAIVISKRNWEHDQDLHSIQQQFDQLQQERCFEDAHNLVAEALRKYKNDSAVLALQQRLDQAIQEDRRQRRENIIQELRSLEEEAQTVANPINNQDGLQRARAIVSQFQDDTEIQSLSATTIEHLSAIQVARQHLADGNLPAVLDLCREYLARYPNHAFFTTARTEAEQRRKAAYIEEAKLRVENEPNLSTRIEILQKSAAEYSDVEFFQRELESTRNKLSIINSAIEKSRAAEEAGQYDEALEHWEVVRSTNEQHPDLDIEVGRIAAKQASARALAIASYTQQTEAFLAVENYSSAEECLSRAKSEYPEDAALTGLQQRLDASLRRQRQTRNLLSEAVQLSEQAQYPQAREKLRVALNLNPQSGDLRDQVLDHLLKMARSAVEKDWRAAEEVLADAAALSPGLKSIKALAARIADRKREEAVEQCLSEIKTLQAAGDFRRALVKADNGHASYPDEARLRELRETLLACLLEARARDVAALGSLLIQAKAAVRTPELKALLGRTNSTAGSYAGDSDIQAIASKITVAINAKLLLNAAKRRRLLIRYAAIFILAIGAGFVAFRIWINRVPTIPTTFVQIHTSPDGANVLLNGHSCITPNCSFELPNGKYPVEVRKDGYEAQSFTFDTTNGARSISRPLAPLKQGLEVSANFNGRVWLDDQLVGQLKEGHFALEDVAPADHTLKVMGEQGEATFTFTAAPGMSPVVHTPIRAQGVQAFVSSSLASKARVFGGQEALRVDGGALQQMQSNGTNLDGLVAGTHELRLGDGTDQRTIQLQIRPSPLLSVFLTSEQRNVGTLTVNTGVEKVTVLVDNKRMVTNSRGVLHVLVDAGKHDVRVAEKSGYSIIAPQTQSTEVRKGNETLVSFKLEPIPPKVFVNPPPPQGNKPAVEDPVQIEAQDWDRVRSTNSTDDIDDFLRKHPGGAHAEAARARANQLSQQTQANAINAAKQAEQGAWQAVDTSKKAALQDFLSRFGSGAHAPEARRVIAEIEKREADAIAAALRAKELKDKEKAQPDRGSDDREAINRTLTAYQDAYNQMDLEKLSKVWPSMPKQTSSALKATFRSAKSMSVGLRMNAAPIINGDTATVVCERSLRQIMQDGKLLPSNGRVTIVLTRRSGSWFISSIQ